MSRRVTISVPDDVADQLDAIPARQVSAYVTEALRRRRASEDMRAALAAAGHREFPYNPEGAARRLADRQVSREVREAAIARLAESLGRPVDDVRAELDRQASR
jgi:predicted CoA-binding protein